MIQNNQKYYLHYDQVGTLKAVSNTNQKIIKKIVYDTYGNIRKETNKGFKVPFGFAGGLYDVDTKLTRFGYRDYDAYTGKWTAKDPIDFGGGDSNLYGYVLQNPVSGIDPSGLFTEELGYLAVLYFAAVDATADAIIAGLGITSGYLFSEAVAGADDVACLSEGGKQTAPSPFKDLEDEFLDMGQGDPCSKIREMIRKMQEQIRWRQGDLNPSSSSYRGHMQRINILEK